MFAVGVCFQNCNYNIFLRVEIHQYILCMLLKHEQLSFLWKPSPYICKVLKHIKVSQKFIMILEEVVTKTWDIISCHMLFVYDNVILGKKHLFNAILWPHLVNYVFTKDIGSFHLNIIHPLYAIIIVEYHWNLFRLVVVSFFDNRERPLLSSVQIITNWFSWY